MMRKCAYFSPEDRDRFKSVYDALTHHGDHYRLLADYASYVACQDQVGQLYQAPQAWTHKAILNVAGMGQFSSDRTIAQYAKTIWNTEPKARPAN